MDVDFQFGLLRGKVRVKKNPPRSGVLSGVPILPFAESERNNDRDHARCMMHHTLLLI